MISKDKRTYTIPLRQGIEFNDGTPFNAQAVVTTLQRQTDAAGLDARERLGADRQHHRFRRLHRRDPPEDAVHAAARRRSRAGDGVVLSPTQLAKLGTNFGTNPVCVGPFMFDHRVVGDNVTVIKSPYYYDRRAVHLDKIVFKADARPGRRGGGAEGGRHPGARLGLADRAPGRAAGRRACACVEAGRARLAGIDINIGNRNGDRQPAVRRTSGTPLAASPLLRQAFEEAIDRDDARQGRLRRPAHTRLHADLTREPVRSTRPSSARPTTPRTRGSSSPRSGFPNPTVRLLSDPGDGYARAVHPGAGGRGRDQRRDRPVDNATLSARGRQRELRHRLLGGFSRQRRPRPQLFRFVATSGSRNVSGYSNPRLDLILANARKATRAKARKTLYHAAEQILLDDRPIIYLYHPIVYAGISTSVTGRAELPARTVASRSRIANA